MKVTYIHHSSFLIETKSCYLLFDYFAKELPDMDKHKPMYVFASHNHGDHYSTDIYKLNDKFDMIYYILSKDIKYRVPEELKESVVFVKAYERYEVGSLIVETLKSTDKGVAFLISVDDNAVPKLIYHAGDLNCWMWEVDTKAENNNAKKRYLDEMERMSGRNIFLAFVPLDSRQEQYFDLGMKYFLEKVGAEHVFPMHMWEDYDVIPRFKNIPAYEKYKDLIADIHYPLEHFKDL